eukprot:CAMPEP_0177313734 /NCGR_PEP_ID=MMETSP0368-20130122/11566_1 /TAXON_ID=447022 ORGANISM="Scrippsiella hangoei-like, Strain SHHI-4" /NCGR_SAMPLE_ID=MMETSP0368 /ASSEMBLY_ACC=CAM_ASM_000363 /LENGTH=34 /DNA_ID= /DNA_START= /DNA_END= /DNA_ORIENTATION=
MNFSNPCLNLRMNLASTNSDAVVKPSKERHHTRD